MEAGEGSSVRSRGGEGLECDATRDGCCYNIVKYLVCYARLVYSPCPGRRET